MTKTVEQKIKTMKNAIKRNFGTDWRETLQDVSNHGANVGFSGFIYYAETEKFYSRHRIAIVNLVENLASELGGTPIEMVQGFNCLNNLFTTKEVALTLYGGKKQWSTDVANALAWFALEEFANEITNS
jgi:hypothetical protein